MSEQEVSERREGRPERTNQEGEDWKANPFGRSILLQIRDSSSILFLKKRVWSYTI
jgi:hypothetical protein